MTTLGSFFFVMSILLFELNNIFCVDKVKEYTTLAPDYPRHGCWGYMLYTPTNKEGENIDHYA